MVKHTPGPWFVVGDMTLYVESKIDGGLVQEIAAIGPTAADNGYGPQQAANATLISVAPILLADLQIAAETLRRYEGYHRAKGTPESLKKAIANQALAIRFEETIRKATGLNPDQG